MKLRGLTVVVLLAALAVPAAAGSSVLPQRGMGGILIGMTQLQVRKKLGDPFDQKHGRNEYGLYTVFTYAKPAIEVTFQGERTVTGISTTSTRQRLTNGIGVGSSLAQLQRRVHVRCQNGTRGLHCFIGNYAQNKLVTDFSIDRAKVSRIFVGYLVDCRVCK